MQAAAAAAAAAGSGSATGVRTQPSGAPVTSAVTISKRLRNFEGSSIPRGMEPRSGPGCWACPAVAQSGSSHLLLRAQPCMSAAGSLDHTQAPQRTQCQAGSRHLAMAKWEAWLVPQAARVALLLLAVVALLGSAPNAAALREGGAAAAAAAAAAVAAQPEVTLVGRFTPGPDGKPAKLPQVSSSGVFLCCGHAQLLLTYWPHDPNGHGSPRPLLPPPLIPHPRSSSPGRAPLPAWRSRAPPRSPWCSTEGWRGCPRAQTRSSSVAPSPSPPSPGASSGWVQQLAPRLRLWVEAERADSSGRCRNLAARHNAGAAVLRGAAPTPCMPHRLPHPARPPTRPHAAV